jgi:hypothetical protein
MIFRYIRVFLARRETGLQELIFFSWIILTLICVRFGVQNFDGVGMKTPEWLVTGEFLMRTLLLRLCSPDLLHWTSQSTGSRTRVNPNRRRGKKRRKRKDHWFG